MMNGPRLCIPREGAPKRDRQPTARPQGDDVADDEEAVEPKAPKGPRAAALIVLHTPDKILGVVCAWYQVTRAWLRRPENHKTEPFRIAIMLLVHDSESASYSRMVEMLNIRLDPEQSASDGVLRIYKSIKAELDIARERLKKLETLRKVLYFGNQDDKRDPPRSIAGLLGRPTPLRPMTDPEADSGTASRRGPGRPTDGEVAYERTRRVVALLQERGKMGSQALARELGISYQVMLKVLQDLMKARRVVPLGTRQLRQYELARASGEISGAVL